MHLQPNRTCRKGDSVCHLPGFTKWLISCQQLIYINGYQIQNLGHLGRGARRLPIVVSLFPSLWWIHHYLDQFVKTDWVPCSSVVLDVLHISMACSFSAGDCRHDRIWMEVYQHVGSVGSTDAHNIFGRDVELDKVSYALLNPNPWAYHLFVRIRWRHIIGCLQTWQGAAWYSMKNQRSDDWHQASKCSVAHDQFICLFYIFPISPDLPDTLHLHVDLTVRFTELDCPKQPRLYRLGYQMCNHHLIVKY